MRNTLWLLAAPALIATTLTAQAQEVSSQQQQMEDALAPPIVFRGEPSQTMSLDESMAEGAIQTVSVAVYRDGALHWSGSYGEGVDTQTLYQAASLSKAVGAAGIVSLAMERGTDLDADISGELAGLDLDLINPEGLPITLRQLLSHTNGAGVSGFPGYSAGETVPSTAQVIEGGDITNTDTVVISSERQGSFNYSGGGYTIAQYWAETVSGEAFPALMRRLVLDPIGMDRSLFAALSADELPRGNVATGYLSGGEAIAGGWNRYPEHAAASLWTTPEEYGLFALALLRALDGDSDGGLAPEVAREMTRIVDNNYGLGVGVREPDGDIRYTHSGSNEGFKANFVAFPEGNDVLVTMTDTENGFPLLASITRTLSASYDWPADPPLTRTRLPASASEMAALAGTYAMPSGQGPTVVIAPGDNALDVSIMGGPTFQLVRVGNATWMDPEDGQEIRITVDDDGTVSASTGGAVFVRQ